jgi:hypothetical protein
MAFQAQRAAQALADHAVVFHEEQAHGSDSSLAGVAEKDNRRQRVIVRTA